MNMTGTSSSGWLASAVAPTNVEIAIPAAASRTASTRVRVTPRNEMKPAGNAPSAAKLPRAMCPVATPMANGVMTPNAAATALLSATSRQRNAPKSIQPGWLSSATRNARPARRSARTGAGRLDHRPALRPAARCQATAALVSLAAPAGKQAPTSSPGSRRPHRRRACGLPPRRLALPARPQPPPQARSRGAPRPPGAAARPERWCRPGWQPHARPALSMPSVILDARTAMAPSPSPGKISALLACAITYLVPW